MQCSRAEQYYKVASSYRWLVDKLTQNIRCLCFTSHGGYHMAEYKERTLLPSRKVIPKGSVPEGRARTKGWISGNHGRIQLIEKTNQQIKPKQLSKLLQLSSKREQIVCKAVFLPCSTSGSLVGNFYTTLTGISFAITNQQSHF